MSWPVPSLTVVVATADQSVTPLPWALDLLTSAAAARGVTLHVASEPDAGPTDRLVLRLDHEAGREEVRTERSQDAVVATGGPVGLGGVLSDLADRLRHSSGDEPVAEVLTGLPRGEHSPAVPVRGILRSFSSDVLDRSWFTDRDFWTGYLDELATHRFNRFHLAFGMQYNYSHDPDVKDNYLCFAYPFLVDVPGWDVTVGRVSAAERAENLAALRWISDETARRGMTFQLGLWNHAVQPELGESPHLRYPVSGVSPDQVASYSGRALQELLRACPSIGGVTFRVHYEGGVSEVGHGDFWREVMGGLAGLDRPVALDLHSKGVDAELLEAATASGSSVTVSAKYWAEHQGLPYHQSSVRATERPRASGGPDLRGVTQNQRRFTRYGYGDFLPRERGHEFLFRVWPGGQRFLLWGDPAIAAGYGRLATFAGAQGVEFCEPLTFRGRKDSGRDASTSDDRLVAAAPRDLYADPSLRLGRDDWRKYSYTYRLLGRLTDDPDSAPETWRRSLEQEFGPAAADLEEALGRSGKVLPLVVVAHGVSASNNYYWPEVYWNMPLARGATSPEYGFDVQPPGHWGAISAFDPVVFASADDAASEHLAGQPSGRTTPVDVALRLEAHAGAALAAVERAARTVGTPSPAHRRAAVDATIQALLGRFFAARLRAGVAYSLFTLTGNAAHLARAVLDHREGRAALSDVVDTARGVYVDDLGFGDRPTERGTWSDRLDQVDADLAELERELDEAGDPGPGGAAPALAGTPREPEVLHRAASTFRPGAAVDVVVDLPSLGGAQGMLRYRRANQGEDWCEVPMRAEPRGEGTRLSGSVPADYTRSPHELLHRVVVRDPASAAAWSFPGLGDGLDGQPYHLVRAEPSGARPAP